MHKANITGWLIALLVGAALGAAGVSLASPQQTAATLPGLAAQVAQLQTRVTQLESFDKTCLRRIHLSQSPDGWMVWDKSGVGLPTPYAANFYGMPDTQREPLVCFSP